MRTRLALVFIAEYPTRQFTALANGFSVGQNYNLVANFPTASSQKLVLKSSQTREFITMTKNTDAAQKNSGYLSPSGSQDTLKTLKITKN